jgi:hypothetical protein
MWVVGIVCRHYGTVMCRLLWELLLYRSFVVTCIQLVSCVVTTVQICVHCYGNCCYIVHLSSLGYSSCSQMLCKWILYCPYVVTVIQVYVVQCYVIGYYIVQVLSPACSYIQLTRSLTLNCGNCGLCTVAVTLNGTDCCPRTVSAVCTYLTAKLVWFWQIFTLCNV